MNTNSHPTSVLPTTDSRQTTWQKKAPLLSSRALTLMLIGMALMPVITISGLWIFLPPTFEGQLDASVSTEGLPSANFYLADYYQRPKFEGGFIIIRNNEDVDWTHLNIQVNGWYQTYDIEPIPPKSEKRFQLSKFVTRFGHNFKLQYVQLNSIRIYARRPSGDRATFYQDFDLYGEAETKAKKEAEKPDSADQNNS